MYRDTLGTSVEHGASRGYIDVLSVDFRGLVQSLEEARRNPESDWTLRAARALPWWDLVSGIYEVSSWGIPVLPYGVDCTSSSHEGRKKDRFRRSISDRHRNMFWNMIKYSEWRRQWSSNTSRLSALDNQGPPFATLGFICKRKIWTCHSSAG